MVNLLLFSDIFEIVFPLAIFFAIFIVVIVSVISVAKRASAEARKREYMEKQRAEQQRSRDATQTTDHQREYLDSLRNKKAQGAHNHNHAGNTIVSREDGHTHVGSDEEEVYGDIVGSLGEVDDEGCVDLAGVRLISHDESYESTESSKDYSEVVKAVVLGDIINKPRFKNKHNYK